MDAARQAGINRASKSLTAELVQAARTVAASTRMALLDKDATGIVAEPVIFAELLYLCIHLAHRAAQQKLSKAESEYLLTRLIADTNVQESTFASRQAHYAKFAEIAPAAGGEYKGTLLWETGARLAGSHASSKNPARIGLVISQVGKLPGQVEAAVGRALGSELES
jgi:hypothetical protein